MASHLKIEAKGPDNTLRLRQVKALGYVESPLLQKQPHTASIQQKNCEAETLRVFRLITSQVFGRLLDHVEEEAPPASAAAEAEQQQQPGNIVEFDLKIS